MAGKTYGVDMTGAWKIRKKIRKQLEEEGFDLSDLDGPGIRKFRELKDTKLAIPKTHEEVVREVGDLISLHACDESNHFDLIRKITDLVMDDDLKEHPDYQQWYNDVFSKVNKKGVE